VVSFNEKLFNIKPKIIWRQTSSYFVGTIFNGNTWFNRTIQAGYLKQNFSTIFDLKYILCLLMSQYLRYLYVNTVQEDGRVFPQVKLAKLGELPIYHATSNMQEKLIKIADVLFNNKKKLNQLSSKFITLLISDLKLKKSTKNILYWYKLSSEDFISELKKQKISLTLEQKDEWITYFNKNQLKVTALLSIIKQAEKKLNRIVYKLYKVNDNEITLIESSSNSN
jgi:hypothetical protein